MTVTYNQDLATASWLAAVRTVFRWKGGLWKSVYKELLVWCLLYVALSLIYRLWLTGQDKRNFEEVVGICNKYTDFVPLTFMLGYYVTLVVGRWWNVIMTIGFIDNPALIISNYIRGTDERSIMYKRTIVRYVCLVQAMYYRAISVPVRRKYPNMQSLVDAGYLEQHELETFAEDNLWLGLHWALSLAQNAREEGVIKSNHALQDISRACSDFRASQTTLWIYNWIPVPLVYSQVVFITVRLYFLIAVVGRQYTEHDTNPIDLYVPFLTMLQFIFYVGWLKVAEALVNPFGDDEDDFDAEWFLQRNLRNALAIMDEKNSTAPPLGKDKFWHSEAKANVGFTKIGLGQAMANLPLFKGALPKYSDHFEF